MRLGKDVLEADLYADLGVRPDATASEIRVAYRRNARASHPDLNQLDPHAAPRMTRVNVAARVLLDPVLRRVYDGARRSTKRQPFEQKPARRAAWFERSELSLENDWVSPAPTARVQYRSAGFGGFLTEVRGRAGHFSMQLDELIGSLTKRQQITFSALLVATALCLIVMARPHSLGVGRPGSHQPSSVDASMLFP